MLVAAIIYPGEPFARILLDTTPAKINATITNRTNEGETVLLTLMEGRFQKVFTWRDGVFYDYRDGLYVDIEAWIRRDGVPTAQEIHEKATEEPEPH